MESTILQWHFPFVAEKRQKDLKTRNVFVVLYCRGNKNTTIEEDPPHLTEDKGKENESN